MRFKQFWLKFERYSITVVLRTWGIETISGNSA